MLQIGAPLEAHPAYSFQKMVLDGLLNELDDATNDTGPIDCDDALRIQREYDLFYGTSPLSSPSPSPPTSRPTSPLPPNVEVREGTLKRGSADLESQQAESKSSKQRRNARKSKRRRRDARRQERDADIEATRTSAAAAAAKHIWAAEEMPTAYSAADIPSASSGYIALRDDGGGQVLTLAELLGQGFELVRWDGSTSRPVVDSNGLVVAVLVGMPVGDPTWERTHEEAFSLLEKGYDRCRFTKRCADHRRGKFAALNAGISFGGGQKMPGNLCHNTARTDVLQGLLSSPCFKRLAGFASGAFRAWMPNLYGHYDKCLAALLARHGSLHRNFENSVWGSAAFNFGPRTVTAKHRDFANLPYGICSITALGHYNYIEGGHIVLWEFGLVVQFPQGSTILIPSAAVAHSNTPVAKHERRCSFTQYSAGGLFRWVDQGFQKSEMYTSILSAAELAQLDETNKLRCALGMSLFSKLADLRPSKKM